MYVRQHGTKYVPRWELELTCSNCDAIFVLENASDIYGHPVGKIGNSYVYYDFYAVCPECGELIQVSDEELRGLPGAVKYK